MIQVVCQLACGFLTQLDALVALFFAGSHRAVGLGKVSHDGFVMRQLLLGRESRDDFGRDLLRGMLGRCFRLLRSCHVGLLISPAWWLDGRGALPPRSVALPWFPSGRRSCLLRTSDVVHGGGGRLLAERCPLLHLLF